MSTILGPRLSLYGQNTGAAEVQQLGIGPIRQNQALARSPWLSLDVHRTAETSRLTLSMPGRGLSVYVTSQASRIFFATSQGMDLAKQPHHCALRALGYPRVCSGKGDAAQGRLGRPFYTILDFVEK